MLMQFFESQMDYVLFVYGIVLVVMGVFCCVGNRRQQDDLPWRWFGAALIFGGIDKFIGLVTMILGQDFNVSAARCVALVLTNLAMLEFARIGHRRLFGKGPGPWIYAPLLVLAGLGALAGKTGLGISVRYAIAVPATLWSAVVLARLATMRRPVVPILLLGAVTLGVVSILTGVFVPRGSFFPASVVNQEWLEGVTGVPIYVLRGLVVIFAMVLLWLYHQSGMYRPSADDAMTGRSPLGLGFAIAMLAILGAGWAVTGFAGRYAATQIRLEMISRGSIAAASMDETHLRRMTGTKTDLTAKDHALLRRQLRAISESTDTVDSIDIVRPEDGRFILLASSQDGDGHTGHEPGTVYDQLPAELARAMAEKREIISAPYKGESGTSVTEVVPLLSRDGTAPYAALCVNMNAAVWRHGVMRLRLAAIMAVAAAVAIVVASGAVWQRMWLTSCLVAARGRLLTEAERIARMGSWTYDVFSKQYSYSDEVVRLFGYEAGVSVNWQEIHKRIDENDLAEMARLVAQCAAEGRVLTIEMGIKRADGVRRHMVCRASPVKDEQERTIRLVGTMQDISEHKQMEDSLRSTQSLLSDAMELAGLVHWEYDRDTDTFRLNERIYTILGTNVEQEGGYLMQPATLISRFVLTDDAAMMAMEMERAVTSSEPVYRNQIEIRFVRTDGSVRTCVVRLMTVRNEQGRVTGLRGSSQDITEHRRAEDALHESQSRLVTVMENLPDPTFVIDRSGRVTTWNRAMENLTGVKAEAMLGKGDYECSIPFYGDRRPTLAHLAMSGDTDAITARASAKWQDEILTAEGYAPNVRGSRMYLYATVTVLRNLRGEVVAAVESIRDITERKRMEEALRVSQAQLSDAMELAKLAYWEYNLTARVFTFNNMFYELYVTSAEREGGYAMPFDVYVAEFLMPEDAASLERELHAAAESTQAEYFSHLTHRIRRRDGEVRTIETRLHAIRDGKGNAVKCYGVNQDVTDQRKAEEEIKRSVSLLKATLESTADGILVVDNTGKVSGYNERFVQLWRIPAEVMATGDDVKLIETVLGQLKEPQQFVSKVTELYLQPEAESFDVLEFTDGRVFERYSQPQLIEGKYAGRVWSFRDVTEKKRTEEALRHERDLVGRIAETTPAGIVALDRNGVIVFANVVAEHLLGLTDGKTGSIAYNSANFRFVDSMGSPIADEELPFHRVRTTGLPIQELFHAIERSDGSRVLLSINAAPLFASTGEFDGMVAVFEDITDAANDGYREEMRA